MTRETKIGLLVGLAFIIVIGILLSDNFRSKGEPPQASLANAASNVRQGVNSPGTSNPPITLVVPSDAPPRQAVPTNDELNRPAGPVIVKANNNQSNPLANLQAQQVNGADSPVAGDNALTRAAQQQGESLIPANQDGTPKNDDTQAQGPATPTARSYIAQPGDTVSRMAAKFLGANTRANRQLIISANPDLQSDPNSVDVGQTYIIPSRIVATPTAGAPTAQNTPAPAPLAASVYVVQPGDSLWRIANDVVGDPNAVGDIQQLNMNVLHGANHDVVTPGMKLRLPGKPLAAAN